MKALIELLKSNNQIIEHTGSKDLDIPLEFKTSSGICRCCFSSASESKPPLTWRVNTTMQLSLDDWLPKSLALKNNFLTIDRIIDPTRLAGLRYQQHLQTLDDLLKTGISFLTREGGKIDTVVANKRVLKQIKPLLNKIQSYEVLNFLEADDENDDSIYLLTLKTFKVISPENILVCIYPGENMRCILSKE